MKQNEQQRHVKDLKKT